MKTENRESRGLFFKRSCFFSDLYEGSSHTNQLAFGTIFTREEIHTIWVILNILYKHNWNTYTGMAEHFQCQKLTVFVVYQIARNPPVAYSRDIGKLMPAK